ncbi:MAG: hypothetical protein Q6358_07085 [Candidatus Brocadiales bacterium]|nr:hypothetical protein [Candidatus Brocadiales bacterium]
MSVHPLPPRASGKRSLPLDGGGQVGVLNCYSFLVRSNLLLYFQNKCYVIRWAGILSFIYIVHMLGCAPLQVKEGTFSPPHKKYTINLPGKNWEPIKIGKEDIALRHKQYHAMITFISSDIESKKVSLEMLNSQLFIGMKNKKILLNDSMLVDNQAAMHTILVCEIDNHKLKVESYVVMFENKVYDLVSWAPTDLFDNIRKDFENIIKSFKFSTYSEQ